MFTRSTSSCSATTSTTPFVSPLNKKRKMDCFDTNLHLTQLTDPSSTSVDPLFTARRQRKEEVEIHRMMEDLPKSQIEMIKESIKKVSQEDILQLQHHLDRFHESWNHPFFKQENVTFILLAALQSNAISLHQFTSLEFFYEALQAQRLEGVYECHQITSCTHEDPAFAILKKSYNYDLPSPLLSQINKQIACGNIQLMGTIFSLENKRNILTWNKCQLNEDQEMHFLELLRNLPPTERCFFIFPPLADTSSTPLITDILCDRLGIKAFIKHDDGRHLVVSFGILQAYLKAKFGQEACRPQICLGEASIKKIRNGFLFKRRPLSLMPPNIISGEILADSYKAPGGTMLLHDFYHHLIFSQIPSEHLGIYVQLISGLRNIARSNSEKWIKEFLYKISWHLTDADFSVYYSEVMRVTLQVSKTEDTRIAVFYELERCFCISFSKCFPEDLTLIDAKKIRSLFIQSSAFHELCTLLLSIPELKRTLYQACITSQRHYENKMKAIELLKEEDPFLDEDFNELLTPFCVFWGETPNKTLFSLIAKRGQE